MTTGDITVWADRSGIRLDYDEELGLDSLKVKQCERLVSECSPCQR